MKISIFISILYYLLSSSYSNATTLEDALVATYNNNPAIKANREDLKIADEAIIEALSGFLPHVSSQFTKGRVIENSRFTRDDNSPIYNDLDSQNSTAKIVLRQSIFRGGADFMQHRIAKKFIEASRAKLSKGEQEVFLSAISAYINILLQQEKFNIHKNSVSILTKYVDSMSLKFKLGEVTKADVAQANSKLANAVSEFTKAQGALVNANTNYESITGTRPYNLTELDNFTNIPSSFDDAKIIASQNNHDIIIAKTNNDIEAKKILQAAAAFSPKLDLEASIFRDISSIKDKSEASRKNRNKQIMLNLEIPIYQKGLEYQGLRKQKYSYQKSKNSLQLENDKLNSELTKTWEDIAISDSIINATKESINSANIALESITKEAELGQRTTIEVLETEHQLMQAKLSLVDARYNKMNNVYILQSQLGRLTAKALALPTPIYDPKIHYNKTKFKIIGF